jgi:hypothetical protein
MKKLFIVLCMLLMVGVFASNALAAGSSVTVTQTTYMTGDIRVKEILFTCVGDDGSGAVADTDFNKDEYVEGWYLYNVETDPGATAPDAADVLIKNAAGRDLLDGQGTDLLHATATQSLSESVLFFEIAIGTLTFDVDNQGAVDALYTVTLTFIQ